MCQFNGFITDLSALDNMYEKTLLLHSINSYIEKIEFVLENSVFYCTSDFVIDDLKKDLILLKDLRKRIFIIDIKNKKEKR